MMTSPSLEEVLTVYHPEHGKVTSKTKLYYIGPTVCALTCKCANDKGVVKPVKLEMYCPTHYATPTCYCERCDTLYIGTDQNVRKEQSEE